ncbi:MAG: heavy metal translocating P-type ATPase, partial [Planctomycetota bacterium]
MVKAARRLYRVEGMDCAEETSALRRELEPLSGVQSVSFDLLQGRMTVVADDEQVRDADVAAAAARAGLRAEPWTEAAGARRLHLRGTVLSAAGVLGGLGLSLAGGPGVPLYARGVYALGVVAGLWQVLPKALAALRRLRPDMNLLMCVAVAGAMALDEWFEAGTVAALFSLSLTLEAWSVGRARRAIGTLLELAPTETTRLEGGREVSVPVDQVRAGDRVLVKPGSRVPLDGTIVSGETEVDQSPVTGESLPVPKGPGDFLYAGSVNGSAAVELEVDRPASNSTLAHIARLVEEAREQSSSSERWVERFARVYTPAVMLLALLVMLLPPLLWGEPWGRWTYSALVLLVIACPCALVISTPVSIVAGLTSAARHGVLVKSGRHLETPARLRAFAFDKTGTLTWGRPKVVEVVPLDGHTEEELLARAAAVEARSEHPIAQAILSAAEERGVEAVAAT